MTAPKPGFGTIKAMKSLAEKLDLPADKSFHQWSRELLDGKQLKKVLFLYDSLFDAGNFQKSKAKFGNWKYLLLGRFNAKEGLKIHIKELNSKTPQQQKYKQDQELTTSAYC